VGYSLATFEGALVILSGIDMEDYHVGQSWKGGWCASRGW
jgi:hypothetical protein